LDNDAVGSAAAQRLRKLRLPPQIRVLVLPELRKCSNIRTVGPSGQNFENVNGRAVSIEFFLDLSYGTLPEPSVRWTSYDASQGAYQGELVDKELYVRGFFDHAGKSKSYDLSSLAFLWQEILTSCVGQWS
jgi:hypothetical protein